MRELENLLAGLLEGMPEEQKLKLQRGVEANIEEIKKKAEIALKGKEESIVKRPRSPVSSTANKPLTREEADIIDERLFTLRDNIKRIKDKVTKAEETIKNSLERGDGRPSYVLNIEDKPKLKKAARKVFGERVQEITFQMYREALEEKARLEREDANSFFEEEDEDGILEKDSSG